MTKSANKPARAAAKKTPATGPSLALAAAIRGAALDIWRNLRHERVHVPEWGGDVVLRAMTVNEWREYGAMAARLQALRAFEAGEEVDEAVERRPGDEHGERLLYAYVLTVALHDTDHQPVFGPDDVPAIAAAYCATHDRLAAKVFELSQVPTDGADPVDAAGND